VSSEPDGDVTGQPLVARELRRFRERAGLSRNQLATRVGYSRTYISTGEKPGARGRRRPRSRPGAGRR